MYFTYRRFGNHLGPYFTVSIAGTPLTALIDSGANVTLVSKYTADFLGLTRGPPKGVIGIAGSGETALSAMEILVPNVSSEPMRIPCLIVDQDIPILLGRAGFFDAFDIVFHQKGGVFAVSPAV